MKKRTLLPQAVGRAMEWPVAFAWKAICRPTRAFIDTLSSL